MSQSFNMTVEEYVRLYEYLREHGENQSYSDIARGMGWYMSNKLPYHIRSKRCIDRLIKRGHIKQELLTRNGSVGTCAARYRYSLICAPIPQNAPMPAPMEPVSKTGLVIERRTLYTAKDVVKFIRYITNVAAPLKDK